MERPSAIAALKDKRGEIAGPLPIGYRQINKGRHRQFSQYRH